MELWIRSQKGTRLIKANNILMHKFDTGEYGIQIDGECFVGEYATKERALEVLDEIQKILEPQTIINYESKLEFHPEYTVQNVVKTIPKTEIKEISTYVYEMPKE